MSRFPPKCIEPEDLQTLLESFQRNNKDPAAVQILSRYGFYPYLIDMIQNRLFLKNHTLEMIQTEVGYVIGIWKEQWLRDNMKTIHNELISSDTSMFFIDILTDNPDLVVTLERENRLPLTGNYETFVLNYLENRYTNLCLNYKLPYDICWFGAAEHGHIEIIKTLLQRGFQGDIYKTMQYVCANDHPEIAKIMFERGIGDYVNFTASCASSNGRVEILKIAIAYGANNFNECMMVGCHNLEIVQLVLQHGANNFNDVMYQAALIFNRIDIVRLMLQHGANNFNNVMAAAAHHGNREIIQLMLDHNANDFNNAMSSASDNDNKIDIVQKMLDLGANEFTTAMIKAASSGSENIVKLFMARGYHDVNAPIYAEEHGHRELAELIRQIQAKPQY